MSETVVVVSMQAGEGRGDELVEAFRDAIEQSHREEGCALYALHRDKSDPDHFVHIEAWRSQADVDAHMKQPYLGELYSKMGSPGLIAGKTTMWFLDGVPIGDAAKGQL
jgi:quinol monooxygenase YgiN